MALDSRFEKRNNIKKTSGDFYASQRISDKMSENEWFNTGLLSSDKKNISNKSSKSKLIMNTDLHIFLNFEDKVLRKSPGQADNDNE